MTETNSPAALSSAVISVEPPLVSAGILKQRSHVDAEEQADQQHDDRTDAADPGRAAHAARRRSSMFPLPRLPRHSMKNTLRPEMLERTIARNPAGAKGFCPDRHQVRHADVSRAPFRAPVPGPMVCRKRIRRNLTEGRMASRNGLVAAAAGGSLALLLGAFAFQFIGGLAPCQLCLWQRWPHAAAVLIGAVALAVPGRLLPVLGAMAALATAGIAAFHTGVERGWWEGLATCTAGSIAGHGCEGPAGPERGHRPGRALRPGGLADAGLVDGLVEHGRVAGAGRDLADGRAAQLTATCLAGGQQQVRLAGRHPVERADSGQNLIQFGQCGRADFRDQIPLAVCGVNRLNGGQARQAGHDRARSPGPRSRSSSGRARATP